MRALDTNVVVRLIVSDDRRQMEAALALFASGPVFIGLTVLVETEWVLRSVYDYSRGEIADAFQAMNDAYRIVYEDEDQVLAALDRHREGADFADVMHLVASRDDESFHTFDRKLAQTADALPVPVILVES